MGLKRIARDAIRASKSRVMGYFYSSLEKDRYTSTKRFNRKGTVSRHIDRHPVTKMWVNRERSQGFAVRRTIGHISLSYHDVSRDRRDTDRLSQILLRLFRPNRARAQSGVVMPRMIKIDDNAAEESFADAFCTVLASPENVSMANSFR